MCNSARRTGAGLAAALVAAGALAAPSGRIVQYGRCDAGSGKQVYAQPEATVGYASRGSMLIGTPTDTVPLHKGIGFGYLWEARDLPPAFELTYRIRHPPIVRKDGRRVEMFEETVQRQAADDGTFQTADCYFLDEDVELVPGDWTITLLVQGRVLVTRTFHVVK